MKKETLQIKDLIGKVVEKIEKQTNKNESIKNCWKEVAGENVAMFAKPGNLKKGCLWINVEDSLHLFELKIKKEEIEEKVRSYFPEVKKIKFRIG